MNAIRTQFQACEPMPWNGRYGRIVGNTSVFHLRYVNGRLWPVLLWETDNGIASCGAIDCPATNELVNAVAKAKRRAGGGGGGAFVVDEYGKVLVPASDGNGQRFFVGRLSGRLAFENPFDPQEPIDLANCENLKTGDPWTFPYIGVPYHLHRSGRIYFYQQDAQGGRSVYPAQQDFELIRAIRNVRPHGPVRIVVTPGGLVLTKVPSNHESQSENRWQPVFIGAVNPSLWFEEE